MSSLSVAIRSEQADDHAATEAVALQAFAPDRRVAELVRRLRASPWFIPELNLVAESEGVVAGHVMFSRALLRSGHEAALLSPLGVSPQFQRLGVGSALVRHALRWLEASDYPLVVVEVVPSYSKSFS